MEWKSCERAVTYFEWEFPTLWLSLELSKLTGINCSNCDIEKQELCWRYCGWLTDWLTDWLTYFRNLFNQVDWSRLKLNRWIEPSGRCHNRNNQRPSIHFSFALSIELNWTELNWIGNGWWMDWIIWPSSCPLAVAVPLLKGWWREFEPPPAVGDILLLLICWIISYISIQVVLNNSTWIVHLINQL